MAEALLKDMIDKAPINGEITVMSAGLAAVAGDAASSNAVKVMADYGIDLTSHRSQPATEALLREADLILTMTSGHKQALLAAIPGLWEKTFTLKEYAGVPGGDISDPYGHSLSRYKDTAREIHEALKLIYERISIEYGKGPSKPK
jgi:protein-tyrosine-phosphatase